VFVVRVVLVVNEKINHKIIMILNVNMIRNNKILSKGRDHATDLLMKFTKTLGLPFPNYAYKVHEEKNVVTVNTNTKTNLKKTTKTPTSSSPITPIVVGKQSFICQVSTTIPTPLYQQKLIRDQKRQQRLSLKEQQQQQQQQQQSDSTTNIINGHGINGSNKSNQKKKGVNGNSSNGTNTTSAISLDQILPKPTIQPSMTKKGETLLYGSGESDVRTTARNLAALEVIYQIENILNVERGQLNDHLLYNADQIRQITESHHLIPYDESIPGMSWQNIPTDTSFIAGFKQMKQSQFVPATRVGNIDFFPQIRKNNHAMIAAKAITLSSQKRAPTVDVHSNTMVTGGIQRFANVQASGGPLEGVIGTLPGGEMNIGLDSIDAQVIAMIHLYNKMTHEPTQKDMKLRVKERYQHMAQLISNIKDTSYGMAKLFVSLPPHQFPDLQKVLDQIPIYTLPKRFIDPTNRFHNNRNHRRRRVLMHPTSKSSLSRHQQQEMAHQKNTRIQTFRGYQKLHPLPVDSIEKDIPHDVSVTIVRGGTGSGKVR
jgi:hypothetical protein